MFKARPLSRGPLSASDLGLVHAIESLKVVHLGRPGAAPGSCNNTTHGCLHGQSMSCACKTCAPSWHVLWSMVVDQHVMGSQVS